MNNKIITIMEIIPRIILCGVGGIVALATGMIWASRARTENNQVNNNLNETYEITNRLAKIEYKIKNLTKIPESKRDYLLEELLSLIQRQQMINNLLSQIKLNTKIHNNKVK